MLKSDKFYDELSDIYEDMINFEKNLELRIKAYNHIFKKAGKVADIGCGIGLDSIALAKNGHDVTAIDISPLMIDKVKENSKKYDVKIKTNIHSFNSIPTDLFNRLNYVVSVGNTIAHLNYKELQSALKKVYKLLLPGGQIFFHVLNYELIIQKKKRINNIGNKNGQIIIRFYDFGKKDIDFNILSFRTENTKEYKLITTKHYCHSKKNIKLLLQDIGFSKIKFSGSFMGDRFGVNKSKDLFFEAIKL